MNEKRDFGRDMKVWLLLGSALLFFMAYGIRSATPVMADALEARHLVEKARMTFENFLSDPNLAVMKDLLKDSKAVFIAPQVLKGAFLIGASGGSGVLLARDTGTGQWNGPAFYTLGSVSFGLQAGGEASEVVLLAMTERGKTAFLASNFKLGADVGIAVGPVGIGASAATANLSADVLSFSRSKGLYGGISLDGAVVATRGGLNNNYYGKEGLTPSDVLVRRAVTNPHAGGLVRIVSETAGR